MASLVFKIERMPTPVGELLIVTDGDGALRGTDWTDHEARMRELLRLQYAKDVVQLTAASGVAASEARRALEAYVAGDLKSLATLAVRTGGTPFQREVWGALRTIPAGETRSYSELAVQLNRPAAVRAVGMANGANPISIVVPCHRVIGADGSLTGYGGGLPRKRWLLEHEGVRLASPRRAA
jgi:methylated-DNA-[protein]-cysteine S-methyltransferase